jgi:hypothetical protein
MGWIRRGRSFSTEEHAAPLTLEANESERPEPTVDDLASVVALVVASDQSQEQICSRTGMGASHASAALSILLTRNVIFDSGGGYYQGRQGSCAGSCARKGHELRGQEIVIDAQRLTWWCAPCWDAKMTLGRLPGDKDDAG